MYYVLYNPLSSGGNGDKYLEKLERLLSKKELDYESYPVLDRDKIISLLEVYDRSSKIIICGGDGTLHEIIQLYDFTKIESKVYMFKAGSGNDFARGHQGKIFEITNELKKLPRFTANGKSYKFINGVGIGIDAVVCNEVNKNNKEAGYYSTAIKAFKNFKKFELELNVDCKRYVFNDVFFFVAMNGKYFGGGMKIAPHAKRDDDILDIYIIKAKSFKSIIPIFPLIYLGLHTLAKKHVVYIKGKNICVKANGCSVLQSDGEVINDVSEVEISL